MSTKKRTTARKPAASPLAPKSLFQSLEIPEYGYWIGIAVLTAWYYYFSTVSTGFYQHDEISHYLGMKKFFDEPTSSLSVWAKPGYKILYAIPALLGLKFVFLVNCLVIATTAYICTLIAKELKMGNRLLAMLFFAAQPIILQVSFRCYSEVLVTLLIALLALFYYRKQFIAAALIMSYIFIVRFEMGLIAVIMAGIFLANRRWIPFLLLGTFPLLLNIVGWMVYGDPIWLINDVLLKGTKYQILQMGFFHYWRIFTPVIGALTTGFLLVSLFAFSSMDEFKEFYRKYHMLLILFLVSFFSY